MPGAQVVLSGSKSPARAHFVKFIIAKKEGEVNRLGCFPVFGGL